MSTPRDDYDAGIGTNQNFLRKQTLFIEVKNCFVRSHKRALGPAINVLREEFP